MAIASLVYEVFKRLGEELEPKPMDRFWISELSTCLRRAYYDRVRPLPRPVAMKLRAAMGRGIHELLEKYLEELGCTTEVRVEVELCENTVVGRADAVCGDAVLELKTRNGVEARDSDLRQARYYAALLGLREAYVIVVDRATGKHSVTRVSVNGREMVELERRVRELKEALEAQRPPRRERGPWCEECPYALVCASER